MHGGRAECSQECSAPGPRLARCGQEMPDVSSEVVHRASAARAAHRELRSLLRLFRANYSWGELRAPAFAHAAISRRTNKAVARACHRHNWPETNVGASAARDAPRGRRSVSQATHLYRHTLKATPAGMTLRNGRVCLPWVLGGGRNRAPPARRIASFARSYVCFGPVTPVADARDRLVCTARYRAMRQGVRTQIPQK